MVRMFAGTSSFYQALCWNVSEKKTTDMFLNSKGCIVPSCCPSCSVDLLCALTDDNFKEIVNDWFSNKEQVEYVYGEIKDWDVSRITDMAWLFYEKSDFNEDLAAW